MKKLWIAVNSTSFLLIVIRYEMTIFIEWCSMSSKTFLKGFLKKKSFFCGMLAIQSDTYWCKMSSNLQNLFWSPYVKRFSQRSQIGEIKIIQILLFIVWSLTLIAPKKLLHLNLHRNFDNVLLHGVNVCTQYLPSNRRLSIMFTIPIS